VRYGWPRKISYFNKWLL